VATAIAIGGPGSIFWMWLIALLGSASALIESTLAQLFKVKGSDSFRGGPAYYIQKGLNKRWFAVIFAILISITFGLAFNSVQANTIVAASTLTWGASPLWVGIILSVMTLAIIWGGIKRISRFSEIIVPIMAVFYLVLALVVIAMNFDRIPAVITLIFEEAFTGDAALGGGMGMALLMGIKRGLFSNEAGMGSAPNVAATASVSHPVKQGLLQSLSVFTDTIIICSCTAFIILISGLYTSGAQGIELTQVALESEVGSIGSTFVAIAIFFFAFTSIVSNYYYGETNLKFIRNRQWIVNVYRLSVSAMVLIGSLSTLDFVWAFADLTMALMTIVNLIAIALLGKYAVRCIEDYVRQRRAGRDPVYHRTTIPEISDKTECW
jgi:AGCS family alanine or glycine:cation symporter